MLGKNSTYNSGGLFISQNWFEPPTLKYIYSSVLIPKLQTARTVREVNQPGQGAIIFNVSSAGGFNASPGLAFYASSKFGKSRVCTSLVDRD